MRARRKSIVTYAVVIALFLAITVAYTGPLVFNAGDHVMEAAAGDTMFNMYVMSWTANSLVTNPLNLYNATIFYPNRYTLAYSDLALTNSLIALPVLGATGNITLAFNFVIIISFLISSFGAFLLVDYLARDKIAAFAGGVIFGFALYKLAHLPHMQVLSTGYIPLALLCLHAYTEKKRAGHALLFVVFTVAMFWTAWSYGFFLAFAVLLYLIVIGVMERRRVMELVRRRTSPTAGRRILLWGGGLVAAFLLVAIILVPFVIPYFKVQSENPGFERGFDEIRCYGADVLDFVVAPEISGAWGRITSIFRPDPYLRGNGSERSLFVGLTPLLLSILGIAYLLRRPWRRNRFTMWYYVVLVLASGLMCLGVSFYAFGRHFDAPMPYRLLYYLFPGFKAVRTPGRMIVLVTLGLAVLGGFGVKWVRDRLAGRMDRIAVSFVLVVLLLLLLGEMMPHAVTMARVPKKSEIPEVYSFMVELPGEAPHIVLPTGDDPNLPAPERDFEYAAVEPLRMYFNTENWRHMVNGYSGYIPPSYVDAARLTGDFPSREAFHFLEELGVDYVVVEGGRYPGEVVRRILDWVAVDPEVDLLHESEGNYILELD